ncbi:MAG: orotate phosphoribosyltransferase, partial [Sphingobacterium sp.]
EALRAVGCNVVGLVSIFTYGLDIATANFAEAKCPFFSLCNYDALIKVAVRNGYVLESDISLLEKWRRDPASWTAE